MVVPVCQRATKVGNELVAEGDLDVNVVACRCQSY
jgi:hypothetical protein